MRGAKSVIADGGGLFRSGGFLFGRPQGVFPCRFLAIELGGGSAGGGDIRSKASVSAAWFFGAASMPMSGGF